MAIELLDKNIKHVGIAEKPILEAKKYYEDILSLKFSAIKGEKNQKIKTVFLKYVYY